jgi:hypothetical protein
MDHESPQGTSNSQLSSRHATTHIASVQLSNDPTLSSLPLLTTFLKSYSCPYLGIAPPLPPKQILSDLDQRNELDGVFPGLTKESDELIEQDIRDRFKRMCEGYYDNVCKKLVIEHKVRFRHIFPRHGWPNTMQTETPRTRQT